MSGVDSNLVFEDDKIATWEFNPDLAGARRCIPLRRITSSMSSTIRR
jgi:hypothetical protein